jgi:hypothetical protein
MGVLFTTNMNADLDDWGGGGTGSGGSVAWSASAGLEGTAGGMLVTHTGGSTGKFYKQENIIWSTDNCRAYTSIDLNALTMSDGDEFRLVELYSRKVALTLGKTGSNYNVGLDVKDDSGSYRSLGPYTISDDEHKIEFRVQRATGASDDDGEMELWFGGVSKGSLSNVDLFTQGDNTSLRVGGVGGLDSGISGTMYLDELTIRDDDTQIGVYSTPVSATVDTGIECLQLLEAPQAQAIEALSTIPATHVIPIEALQGVEGTEDTAIENLGEPATVTLSFSTAIEALTRVVATVATSIENQGEPVAVTSTQVTAIETLAVAVAAVATAIENQGEPVAVTSSQVTGIETLAVAVAAVASAIENLGEPGTATATQASAIEAIQTLSVAGTLRIEALQVATTTETSAIESIVSLSLALISAIEAVEGLANSTITSIECDGQRDIFDFVFIDRTVRINQLVQCDTKVQMVVSMDIK